MEVKILNKSFCKASGKTITSFLLEGFPYDILGEIAKHRLFSISCESSRAIKFITMLQQILGNPYIPKFTLNQPGMSGSFVSDELQEQAEVNYFQSLDFCVAQARKMDKLGIHKQDLNGMLKPWMRVSLIITTTDKDIFYELRRGEDAKPNIREFADAMYDLDLRTDARELNLGQWHLPYPELSLRENVAKCGSISYANHGKDRDLIKLLGLHDRLMNKKHSVPFEHSAMAVMPGYCLTDYSGKTCQVFDHFEMEKTLMNNSPYFRQIGVGNFSGFLQYRKFLQYKIPVERYCSNY